MRKFRLLIHGVNYRIYSNDSNKVQPSGFYLTAFVEEESEEEAKSSAISLVKKSAKFRDAIANPADDPPRISIEESEEISDWPANTARPLTGFALYDEPDETQRRGS
jgi:hypothetical protein